MAKPSRGKRGLPAAAPRPCAETPAAARRREHRGGCPAAHRAPRAAGRAALPGRRGSAPGPGPLLPPSGLLPRRWRGGRRKTPPAPLPQHRAPRRPSGLGQAVIGGIPAPGLPRGAPLGARLRITAAAGEKAAPPPRPRRARAPTSLSAGLGKGRALASAAQIAAREGARPAHGGVKPDQEEGQERHSRAPAPADGFRQSEARADA